MIEQDKMYEVVIKSYARCMDHPLMVWFFLSMSLVSNNTLDVAVRRECLVSFGIKG